MLQIQSDTALEKRDNNIIEHSASDMYYKIVDLIEKISKEIFSKSKFFESYKNLINLRAQTDFREGNRILCLKKDTVLHIAKRELIRVVKEEKTSFGFAINELIACLVKLTFQTYDQGGKECLESRDFNQKLFYEIEGDSASSNIFKRMIEEYKNARDQAKSKETSRSQQALERGIVAPGTDASSILPSREIDGQEMFNLLNQLAESDDIPNFLSQVSPCHFKDWKNEYFNYKTANSFKLDENPVCERGYTLFHMLIKLIKMANNKQDVKSVKKYLGLYLFFLRFSLRSSGSLDFLQLKNEQGETYKDLINQACIYTDSNNSIDVNKWIIKFTCTRMDLIAKDLLKLRNKEEIILSDKAGLLHMRAPASLLQSGVIICKKGDTLGHLFVRNAIAKIGESEFIDHLDLIHCVFDAANRKFLKGGGKEFLEARNCDKHLFINDLFNILRNNQTHSHLQDSHSTSQQSDKVVAIDAAINESPVSSLDLPNNTSNGREEMEMEGDSIDSSSTQGISYEDQDNLNHLYQNLPLILFSNKKLKILTNQKEEQISNIIEKKLGVQLIRNLLKEEEIKYLLRDSAALISFIRYVAENYPNDIRKCFNFDEINKDSSTTNEIIENSSMIEETIQNWIFHYSRNINKEQAKEEVPSDVKELQALAEELMHRDKISSKQMLNFIENGHLDILLFTDKSLLNKELIDKIMKWRASGPLFSTEGESYCSEGDTVLDLAAQCLRLNKEEKSILALYGMFISLIKLVIDHNKKLLSHRSEELYFWEKIESSEDQNELKRWLNLLNLSPELTESDSDTEVDEEIEEIREKNKRKKVFNDSLRKKKKRTRGENQLRSGLLTTNF